MVIRYLVVIENRTMNTFLHQLIWNFKQVYNDGECYDIANQFNIWTMANWERQRDGQFKMGALLVIFEDTFFGNTAPRNAAVNMAEIITHHVQSLLDPTERASVADVF